MFLVLYQVILIYTLTKDYLVFMNLATKLECQSFITNEPAKAKCVKDYIDIVRSWKPEEVTEKFSLVLPILKKISPEEYYDQSIRKQSMLLCSFICRFTSINFKMYYRSTSTI